MKSQKTSASAGTSPAKKENVFIKTVKKLSKRWFIDAFTGMALGLFATLIAGTILGQIGELITKINNPAALRIGAFVVNVGAIAKTLMGAGIGAGIAYMLKADKLTIFSCMVAGVLGAKGQSFDAINMALGLPGNPVSAYVTALIACEICLLVAGKTKLDIVVIPLTAMIVSGLSVIFICKYINLAIAALSQGIAAAVTWSPFVMGIVIAVVMGIILTMPTSSAAIWISIAGATTTSPALLLAGGASVVGCAAQMVGFAVASFRENKWGGLIAQGLGTSMLQIPNIMKNPKILIPPTVASAVVGPLATVVFKLKCDGTGGGMGTSGLVGVIRTIASSADLPAWLLILGIALLFFVLPGVISFFVSELLRKIGWIKFGDQKLSL